MEPRELVSQLGSEVAGLLSAALDRVVDLSAAGRIDRSGLRSLHDEIERARRTGIMAQQWIKLTGNDFQLERERVHLTRLIREALQQRSSEFDARGLELRHQFDHAEVLGDPTLLFSMLQTLLDWCIHHSKSRVDLRLDIKSWPAHARLSCAYAVVAESELAQTPTGGHDVEAKRLNTMSWLLLRQMADVQKLKISRQDLQGRTQLVIEFPDTQAVSLHQAGGLEGLDADVAGLASDGSQPLAGRRVLVLAPKQDVRSRVREALHHLGLTLHVVATVDDALQVCTSTVPHALVFEEDTSTQELTLLREGLLKDHPLMAFIRIAHQTQAFEVLTVDGRQLASVSRDAIADSLPAALLFELSREEAQG